MHLKHSWLIKKARSFTFNLPVQLNHEESLAAPPPHIVRIDEVLTVTKRFLQLECSVRLKTERIQQLEDAAFDHHHETVLVLYQ